MSEMKPKKSDLFTTITRNKFQSKHRERDYIFKSKKSSEQPIIILIFLKDGYPKNQNSRSSTHGIESI